MIAVIARMTAKEGQEAELENAMRELGKQVLANEPDCKHYQLCKGQNPRELVVMERYASQAALDAHGKSPHFRASFGKLGELLAQRPAIEVLTELE